MIRSPSRRVTWLIAVAALFAVANVVDYFFFADKPVTAARSQPQPKTPAAPQPVQESVAAPQPAAPAAMRSEPGARSTAELRQRIEHMRSLAHFSREVNEAYAKAALPYAESMASLAAWFPQGRDPRMVLQRAVQQLAADSGVEIETLSVSAPQRIGSGVYQGAATVSVRAGDSGGMLRFLSEAGRPGGGMVWNGFQLSADAQKKQLALTGELRVLLVEAAE